MQIVNNLHCTAWELLTILYSTHPSLVQVIDIAFKYHGDKMERLYV